MKSRHYDIVRRENESSWRWLESAEDLDSAKSRTQEFVLRLRSGDGSFQEIVRQQWNFSPNGSVREIENYAVELCDVRVLEIVTCLTRMAAKRGRACGVYGWHETKRGMNYKATSARGRSCSAGFLMKSSTREEHGVECALWSRRLP